MRRGTINQQYLKVRHRGKSEPVLRGPYYVFSRRGEGKTVGYRLTTAQEVEQARADILAHKRFVALCKEFAEVTEELGRLERRAPEEREAEKKRPRSRSSKTPR
jgi:hypothetical protein